MRKVYEAVKADNAQQIAARLLIGGKPRNLKGNRVDLVRLDARIQHQDQVLVSTEWYGYPYLEEGFGFESPRYDDLEHMLEVQREMDSHNNPPIYDDEYDYDAGLNFWQIKERDARLGLIRFIDDFGNEVIIEGDLPF